MKSRNDGFCVYFSNSNALGGLHTAIAREHRMTLGQIINTIVFVTIDIVEMTYDSLGLFILEM